MDECGICCYQTVQQHLLLCCNKKICEDCLGSLSVPLCPYCRATIPEIQDDPKYRFSRSLDTSYLTDDTISSLIADDTAHLSRSYDTVLMEPSRIVRRQQRRERKLRLRDDDILRNREISRRRKKEIIQRDINECLFDMDDL